MQKSEINHDKQAIEAQMGAKQFMDLWVHESHHDAVKHSFRVIKTVFSQKSPYQQVDVVETAAHGRVLLNDGIIMLTERDEFIYHEMIVHVPLFVHPAAKRVLVIGGGDGGTAREILKHDSVERVVMVEIDEVVVAACRNYMPAVSCALGDPRLEIIFDDAITYVAASDQKFDVVIIDSTDPVGPGFGLFEKTFYQNVTKKLTKNGIMISQAESCFYDSEFQQTIFSNQRPFFDKLHMYLYSTLAYVGGLYGFGFASNGLCPLKDFNANRVKSAGIVTRYYNANIHRAAFMLPNFIEAKFEGILDPVSF